MSTTHADNESSHTVDTTSSSPAVRRASLPLTDVDINDSFWAPRRRTVRERTLPHQEHHLRTGGQFDALTLQWKPGDPLEPHPFWESDVAKWIEASSYSLATTPDPHLEASLDEAIALLAGAQQPDGYLDTYFLLVKPGRQFTDLRDGHELYCAGHLIEAGVAHHQATGKTTLLEIVVRLADLVDRETRPGGRIEGGYGGHEEIELALVKLASDTGERRYLDLAVRLLENRGRDPYYFDAERERRGDEGWASQFFPDRPARPERYREYCQAHRPVREQREVVGHAVRAMYLYSAMADVAAELGDEGMRTACEALWDDLVDHKIYITGGLGSDSTIEGFGPAYDLPDVGSYAETCASIGLVFWAHRMMKLTGEGRYIDVLERALYNGVISGASLSGTEFFYGNPLASDGGEARQEWFGVACCPPNYARLMTSLGRYVYVVDAEGLYVNLYASGSARFEIAGHPFTVTQSSVYPWDGRVTIRVSPATSGSRMSLRLRVPGWARSVTLRVGGVERSAEVVDGYITVDREWAQGDVVELDLPMEPRRVHPNSRVVATRGRVAFARGPLVYAFEEVDAGAPVRDVEVAHEAAPVLVEDRELGVNRLVLDGVIRQPQEDLYTTDPPAAVPVALSAVPYYAWGNRGLGGMRVWVPEACGAPRQA